MSDHLDDILESCEQADTCKQANERCRQAISKLERGDANPYLTCQPKRRWILCYAYKQKLGMVFDKELGVYILPEWRKALIMKAKPHAHAQWLGSDMACEICNPVCWKNHGFGKDMAFRDCGNPNCPNRGKEQLYRECGYCGRYIRVGEEHLCFSRPT